MTVTALGMVAPRGGRNPGRGGRPFYERDVGASCVLRPHLQPRSRRSRLWSFVRSRAGLPASTWQLVGLPRWRVCPDGVSAQMARLPGAPSLVWAGCPPYRPMMGTPAPLPLSPPGSRTLGLGCPGDWAWGVERGQARPSTPVPIPKVARGPGSTATCSPPAECGAALQRVPGQPVVWPGGHRGHVCREPEAGRVHRSAFLGHQASVRADRQGGGPGAGVPDAGRASAGVGSLAFRPCGACGRGLAGFPSM